MHLFDILGDELLVRTPQGYRLTPRAERVQRRLRAVLPHLESMFAPEEFDPAEAAESFRIAGTDYSRVLAAGEEITLEDYLDAARVIVDTTGECQTAIERRLEDLGARRQAGLTVPCHSLAALSVLGTRLILMPSSVLAKVATLPPALTRSR